MMDQLIEILVSVGVQHVTWNAMASALRTWWGNGAQIVDSPTGQAHQQITAIVFAHRLQRHLCTQTL